MHEAIPPIPQHAFMVWCLLKHRNIFTFYGLTSSVSGYSVVVSFCDYGNNKHLGSIEGTESDSLSDYSPQSSL
jgi:hypothetical protein